MGYDQRNKCQMCVECHFALDIFHACFPSVCVCAALAFSIGLALWTFSVRATRSRKKKKKKRKPSFNRCSALDECYLSLHSDRAEPSLAHARAYRTLMFVLLFLAFCGGRLRPCITSLRWLLCSMRPPDVVTITVASLRRTP